LIEAGKGSSDERREDYENLFATLAIAVKPADAIEWMYFADVVNLTWEIRRMRRIKTGMINSKLEERRTDRLRTAAYLEELSEDEELAEAEEEEEEEEEEEGEAESEDPAALLAEAYCYSSHTFGYIDAIERLTASAEMRRNSALRELAWHSEARARKLDKASREIIDGEFSEAAE
jgi:hypothetical protein